MLSEHDFLTPEECSRIQAIVHGLKGQWVNRAHGFFPFYTLGAASYLDVTKDTQETYLHAAERLNPILETHFPLLYERLAESLSTLLNVSVSYELVFGRPGFHIFLANKMFEQPIASVHFDKQYELLKWSNYEEIDFEHPISFTCPITLPSSGCGLNYWDITQKESKGLTKAELDQLRETKEKLYFPYNLGHLIIHNGLILHQIAPTVNIKPTDERITLQGHGLMCDGIMRLYW